MSEHSIGIRELKANLSDYLEKVRAGANLMVTEHHTPIASLEPEDEDMTLKERVLQLRDAGLLSWNGETIDVSVFQPISKLREDVLASDVVSEERD